MSADRPYPGARDLSPDKLPGTNALRNTGHKLDLFRDGRPHGGRKTGAFAPQNFPPRPSPLPNDWQWREEEMKRIPMPPSTSPWARDDTLPTMQDRVVIPGKRAKGEMSRNDVRFDEPWATDLEDAGVPPPGFFGNGWKHPTREPKEHPPSTLPYATGFLELPHPDIALKPNHENLRREDYNQIHTHKLQSTGLAFLEKREGETQGAFSAEAKRDYLLELKAQMDGQKADRRMEALKHWGWNVGPTPDPRRKIFENFDKDGSGTLSIDELKKVIRHPKVIAAFQLPNSMTHEEIDEFVQEIDENGDGEIDYDEFIQIISAKAGSKASGVIRKQKNEL